MHASTRTFIGGECRAAPCQFVRRASLGSFGARAWVRSAREPGFVRRASLGSFGARAWVRSAREPGFVRRASLGSFGAALECSENPQRVAPVARQPGTVRKQVEQIE